MCISCQHSHVCNYHSVVRTTFLTLITLPCIRLKTKICVTTVDFVSLSLQGNVSSKQSGICVRACISGSTHPVQLSQLIFGHHTNQDDCEM